MTFNRLVIISPTSVSLCCRELWFLSFLLPPECQQYIHGFVFLCVQFPLLNFQSFLHATAAARHVPLLLFVFVFFLSCGLSSRLLPVNGRRPWPQNRFSFSPPSGKLFFLMSEIIFPPSTYGVFFAPYPLLRSWSGALSLLMTLSRTLFFFSLPLMQSLVA